MLAVLLVLLLVFVFFGVGFAAHTLWIIAGILLLIWLLGFVIRSGERARWYRW